MRRAFAVLGADVVRAESFSPNLTLVNGVVSLAIAFQPVGLERASC